MNRDEKHDLRQCELEFDLEYVTETELALCVTDGEDAMWMAKSQIEYDVKSYQKGNAITVQIPEWIAEEHNLL